MTRRCRILLVEDDTILGGAVVQRFELEGMSTVWTKSCAEASRAMAAGTFDFVLADIRLPDGSGETLFRQALPHLGETPIVFVTAFGEIEQAIRLVRAGADDYLTKPFDIDALVKYIRQRIVGRDAALQAAAESFGESPAARAFSDSLRRAAASNLPVLLSGETGSGKEVAARALHRLSPRSARPFVSVDCGAMAPDQMDGRLFGRAASAMTGGEMTGLLEQCAEGTLFLDEVGALPLAVQAALLGVLENGLFRQVGGGEDKQFRGRVVAATNADLGARIAERAFREDLYYRLAVIELAVPPLRDRPGDIPAFSRVFLAAAQERHGRPGLELSSSAATALLRHAWPGNLRELRNRIERAVVLAEGAALSPDDLFPERRLNEPAPQDLKQARLDAERREIELALAESNGRIGEAAKKLGVSRTTLWKKLKQPET
ncbi:MAG: sigma-54-dependent transcriptional regulator [Alphaproteobacteria bacterium]